MTDHYPHGQRRPSARVAPTNHKVFGEATPSLPVLPASPRLRDGGWRDGSPGGAGERLLEGLVGRALSGRPVLLDCSAPGVAILNRRPSRMGSGTHSSTPICHKKQEALLRGLGAERA